MGTSTPPWRRCSSARPPSTITRSPRSSQHQGTYESSGGLLYLSELNLATPSAAHIEHYARIVLEHAVRRRYISAAQQVAELAWNRRRDLDTVKQRAEALVLGASSDTLSRRAVLPPSEWTEHLMDYLGQARTGGLAGVSTGLRDLDTMTLGLSPGLYLVAAATGTGKTAIAGQIALHVAEHHGPVVFVSMELTDVDLAVRLVSVITNIPKEQLVTGNLTTDQGQHRHGGDRASVEVAPAHRVWLGVHQRRRTRIRAAGAGGRGRQTRPGGCRLRPAAAGRGR